MPSGRNLHETIDIEPGLIRHEFGGMDVAVKIPPFVARLQSCQPIAANEKRHEQHRYQSERRDPESGG